MNEDDMHEIAAQLSAQRLLIEVVLASLYAGRHEAFQVLMRSLMGAVQSGSQVPGAMPDEDLLEIQARAATHLLRIRQNVADRLASGTLL